ncbi:sulfurtransferase TusA family protein [Bacillus sp. HMF5848]|uniref:sulfurtransferase TusA family protein n=1 Tax=Bacillus sp. HMF5848 TaxID=2495421 RepID=UPI000F79D338|nr:sulfurtransferase TusA family protein [Bacillus sp. HMF5848]RSK29037.1 sulfurtransferase TusA family protein [Bacillus sp. HMF5848]
MNIEITKSVDARGSYCPGPLMELIKAIKKAAVGDVIEVLSNDKGSAVDIPEWIKKMKHELVHNEKIDDYWKIAVRKMK